MGDALIQLDHRLFLAVNGAHATWADALMTAVSNMYTWFPVYLFFLYLIQRRYGWKGLGWSVPVIALLVLCTDSGSVTLFKETVHRLRPCHDPTLAGLVHLVDDCGGQY